MKKCPYCHCTRLVKAGVLRKKQRYLCKGCFTFTVVPKKK